MFTISNDSNKVHDKSSYSNMQFVKYHKKQTQGHIVQFNLIKYGRAIKRILKTFLYIY